MVDDACDPKQAVAVANQLVIQKVAVVIGHYCSSSSIPASAIYNDAQIIQITPSSTSPKLTDQKFAGVFRTCGRDDQQGIVAADLIASHFADKKLAVIHDKQTYSQGIADATVTALAAKGIKPTLYDTINPGEKDYAALITKLKQAGISVLYYGGYYTEAGLIVRQAADQGLKLGFISDAASISPEFWNIAGTTAEGAYMTFGPDAMSNPKAQGVVTSFKANNIVPDGYTLYAYAAVQVFAQAAGKAQSLSYAVLSKTLHNGAFETIMGDIAYDERGDVKGRAFIVYQWHDGKYAPL